MVAHAFGYIMYSYICYIYILHLFVIISINKWFRTKWDKNKKNKTVAIEEINQTKPFLLQRFMIKHVFLFIYNWPPKSSQYLSNHILWASQEVTRKGEKKMRCKKHPLLKPLVKNKTVITKIWNVLKFTSAICFKAKFLGRNSLVVLVC